MAANRFLIKKLGKLGYSLKLRVVPHHIMRENALASGAGADRMQQGMRKIARAFKLIKEGKLSDAKQSVSNLATAFTTTKFTFNLLTYHNNFIPSLENLASNL